MPNVHFKKNEVIFQEGYPADSVYLICEGGVEVFKKRGNQQIPLAKLGEGAIFGEMAFISDRPRSATVMSTDDTWCYSINQDTFERKLATVDPVVVNIFHNLTDTIREMSNAAAAKEKNGGGEVAYGSDINSLALQEVELDKVTPQYEHQYLMEDKVLKKKVEAMDFFLRKLFYHLVKIAYRY